MASKAHTDDIYREKRSPKNPIKFAISLNEEQTSIPYMVRKKCRSILKMEQ